MAVMAVQKTVSGRPTYAHTPGSGRPNPASRTEQTQAFERRAVRQPQRTLPQAGEATTVAGAAVTVVDNGDDSFTLAVNS